MNKRSIFFGATLLAFAALAAARPTVQLRVDARAASSKILHASMTIPVSSGPLTLIYPKYIPGEHGPTGPIQGVTGLTFQSQGKRLAWQRDPLDMFRIRLEVPQGATQITANLDFLTPVGSGAFTAGVSATPNLFVLNWNQLVLYPADMQGDEVEVQPTLILPDGWGYGTALLGTKNARGEIDFAPVTLETLIDSPLAAGKYFREVDISVAHAPKHFIDVVSDSEAALAINEKDIERHKNLVTQAGHLFGARHYARYHFLLTLSDNTAHFGLEHHQSSDDRTNENFFTDADSRVLHAGLLPHEFVHSWNGKYRRPAGLATGDYDTPMQTRMLWVYEGLTTFLGDVLTARSGLWSEKNYRDYLAVQAAQLDHRTGRRWRALQDTATAAQILYGEPADRQSWRRRVDFYREGELIWLEADGLIRKLSRGKRSMDNFVKRFYGMEDGVVRVNPYTFDDVVQALQETQKYDWATFLRTRLDRVGNGAPLQGLAAHGWSLAYQNKRNGYQKRLENERGSVDAMYSVGLSLNKSGTVMDVLLESPAATAGIAAGMKVIATNGRAYDAKRFRAAIADTSKSGKLELLMRNQGFYSTHDIVYNGGPRYPVLQRKKKTKDTLSGLLAPRRR